MELYSTKSWELDINPLLPDDPFLYPLKTSENRSLFFIFWGYKKETSVSDGSNFFKNTIKSWIPQQ